MYLYVLKQSSGRIHTGIVQGGGKREAREQITHIGYHFYISYGFYLLLAS